MIAVVVSGYTMGLAVIRSLGRRGVPIILGQYEETDVAQYSRHVSETVRLPHPNRSEDAFIDALMALGERLGVAILIPASDASLGPISRAKSTLGQHFRVASVDGEVSRLFLEKERTYRLAAAAGVAVPATVVPVNADEVLEFGANVRFPLLLRPSQSHLFVEKFGTKVIEVHDVDQLVAAYRRVTDCGLAVMLQEIIPGPAGAGVSYSSYVVDGQVIAEFTARQLRNAPSRYGSPRVAVSEQIHEAIDPGRLTVEALSYTGFSCVEFVLDARNGQLTLMELNGRHNLSGLLAARTGIDFPWIEYEHLVYGRLPGVLEFLEGVYWIDIVRDIGESIRSFRTERLGLQEFSRPYLRRKAFAIWDARDPVPFLQRVRGALGTSFADRAPWRSPHVR